MPACPCGGAGQPLCVCAICVCVCACVLENTRNGKCVCVCVCVLEIKAQRQCMRCSTCVSVCVRQGSAAGGRDGGVKAARKLECVSGLVKGLGAWSQPCSLPAMRSAVPYGVHDMLLKTHTTVLANSHARSTGTISRLPSPTDNTRLLRGGAAS